MKRLFVAVGLGILMWACGDDRQSFGPTSPSAPQAPAPPQATYTLSGAIFEATPTGQAPVAGVLVTESTSRRAATTDNEGLYRLVGLPAGVTSVSVFKDGYEPHSRSVTISSDTRLDIQLVQRAFYTLSGVVSEVTPTGLAPIEGVRVEESHFHANVTTDKDGFYSFRGPYGTGIGNSVWFGKEGYQSETRSVVINGDTRLDVQLVRR